jgi:gas vesicle protein
LATFIGPISGLLGKNDGKHMVATVTVYFHPARSAGSMAEAIIVAYTAVIYAAFLSFTSMAVSILFANQHLLVLGHVVVLIIFCGGGLGLVGWTKQRLGNPLVNVACSLASLVFITVLTKEGAVQAATFSYNKVWQVLKMVIMGTVASTAVSLLIRPTWARKEFRDTFIKATDAMSEMLGIITQSFLSGSAQDLKDDAYIKASNQSRAVFKTLVKNLSEAKYEHYILGTEEEHKIETRLVKCLELLNQNIGGLRSAAETQFTLLSQPEHIQDGIGMPSLSRPTTALFGDRSPSPILSPALSHIERRTSILASIDEVPESSANVSDNESLRMSGGPWRLPQEMESNLTAPDMFSIFIAHLGPPMVSQTHPPQPYD